ncbi:MAG: hypothetical protein Q9179_007645, partial [Wetmoreana sp. 5 TL-2023]
MMLPRLFDLDRKTMKLASTPVALPEGRWDLAVETGRIMHRYLGPGPSLEKMERTALTRFLGFFDELGSEPDGIILDLFAWLRRAMTVSSTDAIYGSENPFSKQAELEQALWDWEHDLTRLLLAPFPSITARKGALARSQFITAMTAYLHHKGHEQASDLTKARYKAGIAYGLSIPAIARFEIGSIMGVLVNSTPTLFWLLIHIYSSPQLLADIRAEASTATWNYDEARTTETKFIVHIPSLKQRFPLLYSTYQETLRFHTHNSSSRMVMQDTLLANRYLLEKGSIVQIPGGSIHSDPSVWGVDATSFNARRFLNATAAGGREKEKVRQHPGAFRSFGG